VLIYIAIFMDEHRLYVGEILVSIDSFYEIFKGVNMKNLAKYVFAMSMLLPSPLSFSETQGSENKLQKAFNSLEDAFNKMSKKLEDSRDALQETFNDLNDSSCSEDKIQATMSLLKVTNLRKYSLNVEIPLNIPTEINVAPVLEKNISSLPEHSFSTNLFHMKLTSNSVLAGGEPIEDINISIRTPSGFDKNKKYPVVLVASGVQVGKESLNFINDTNNNVLISIDYPPSAVEGLFASSAVERMMGVYGLLENFEQIPHQIALTLMWVDAQPWVERINTIGISFGGFVMPSALAIAQAHGVAIDSYVFAYTGGDLSALLFSNEDVQKSVGSCEKTIIGRVIKEYAVGLDPISYLKRIPNVRRQNNVLFIEATQDQIIPQLSTESFKDNLPASTDFKVLEGGHIDSDKDDIIQNFNDVVFQWLKDQNYIN